MPCQQGRSTGAQNGGRLSVLRQFFCLKQFKTHRFIVFYKVPDVRSALFDDGVPLGFQLHFLCFRAAGVFGVQLAVCFQGAPVRRFVGGTLEAVSVASERKQKKRGLESNFQNKESKKSVKESFTSGRLAAVNRISGEVTRL